MEDFMFSSIITTQPSSSSSSHLPLTTLIKDERSFAGASLHLPASPADVKARIMAHPHYPSLVSAYADCHKLGAPPEVAARLSTVASELETRPVGRNFSTADPELDQFMEAYYDILVKYKEELARPLDEAADFLRKAESQLSSITDQSSMSFHFSADHEKCGACSAEEDQFEASLGEPVLEGEQQRAEDRELKHQLLRKYSGYLGSLRQELSKKKKKGKLPKEARQKLLSWWEQHKKWPYPSESEKVALAESTGLDQKQINNWFINQRKRHWNPSEEMQFMVLDGYHHQQNATSFYLEGHFVGDGSLYRIGP